MSVIYDNTIKAARMTATRDQFADGTLELMAANDTVLAIFTFSATGGTVADDVWTMAFVASTVTGEAGAGTGTIATKAQLKTSGGNARLTGLEVGTDITIDNDSIAENQDVTINSATITHA